MGQACGADLMIYLVVAEHAQVFVSLNTFITIAQDSK